jgi:hypothetical protein
VAASAAEGQRRAGSRGHYEPVSEYIEFFVAPDDGVAAAVRNQGPASAFATVSGSFFAADDAVIAWESVLTGRPADELWASGRPRMVAPWLNDGSAVFARSDDLTAHLVRADSGRLRDIAARWSAQVVADGDQLDEAIALEIIKGVTELAREAVRTNCPLYCWVAC